MLNQIPNLKTVASGDNIEYSVNNQIHVENKRQAVPRIVDKPIKLKFGLDYPFSIG